MSSEPTNVSWKEPASTYGVAFALVLGFALLSAFVGLVAELLYAIVALIFFIVPQKVMERRDLAPEDYGMAMIRPWRNIGWGLLATVVTLPFFAVGYWVWQVPILERSFEFDVDHYRQWAVELQGEPESWGRDEHGVWVWAEDDVLYVGMRNRDVANNQVVVRADRPIEPEGRGVTLRSLDDDGTTWSIVLTSSRGRGSAAIAGATEVELDVAPLVEGRETWPLFVGPNADLGDGEPLQIDRGYWWLLLWLATQILLIALPEEYFYRGYLQTRIGEALESRRGERGRGAGFDLLGIDTSVVVTSILFGLGHLLIPVGGVLLANRIAVFFPALLFGALRRKTGSITAPVVYHAACNMMVLVAAVHFG